MESSKLKRLFLSFFFFFFFFCFFVFFVFWANLTVKKLKRNRLKERAKEWTCRALQAVTTAFSFPIYAYLIYRITLLKVHDKLLYVLLHLSCDTCYRHLSQHHSTSSSSTSLLRRNNNKIISITIMLPTTLRNCFFKEGHLIKKIYCSFKRHLKPNSNSNYIQGEKNGGCDLMSLLSNQENLFGGLLLCLEIKHKF